MRYLRGDEFWDYSRDGTKITITTGTIGTPGTTTVEELASPRLAETRERVLLNKQGREGWKIEKPPAEPPPPAGPAFPPAPPVHDARDPELERAILDDPENEELYKVYGDWLLQQGDPRGQMIALELATRGKPPGDKHHIVRERFEDKHGEYLKGGFEPGVLLHLGFVRRIQLRWPSHMRTAAESQATSATLAQLLCRPASRFLTAIDLRIDNPAEDEPGSFRFDLGDAIAIVARDAPRTLRELSFGGNAVLRDVAVLAPRFSALRRFSIDDLHGELRALRVDRTAIAQIVSAPWPKLESLTLHLWSGGARQEDILPLFARTDLPALRELELRTQFDPDLVDALAASPLAAQLESVAFHYGERFGDEIAFPSDPARFPKLRTLGLPLSRMQSDTAPHLPAVRVYDTDEGRYDDLGE